MWWKIIEIILSCGMKLRMQNIVALVTCTLQTAASVWLAYEESINVLCSASHELQGSGPAITHTIKLNEGFEGARHQQQQKITSVIFLYLTFSTRPEWQCKRCKEDPLFLLKTNSLTESLLGMVASPARKLLKDPQMYHTFVKQRFQSWFFVDCKNCHDGRAF